jgi:hypothetical protein
MAKDSNVNEKAAIGGILVRNTSTLWRHMEQLLYCTPTTARKKISLD